MNRITINENQLRMLVAKAIGIDPREVVLTSTTASGVDCRDASVQARVTCTAKQGAKLLKLVDRESKPPEPG